MKDTISGPQIFVINCGSSSIKFTIFETGTERILARGLAQKLGTPEAEVDFKIGEVKIHEAIPNADHHGALENIIGHRRVAMISYSTGESGSGSDVDKVREATRLAREKQPSPIPPTKRSSAVPT